GRANRPRGATNRRLRLGYDLRVARFHVSLDAHAPLHPARFGATLRAVARARRRRRARGAGQREAARARSVFGDASRSRRRRDGRGAALMRKNLATLGLLVVIAAPTAAQQTV